MPQQTVQHKPVLTETGARPGALVPLLAGSVVGVALQLQQATLPGLGWHWAVGGVALLGLALCLGSAPRRWAAGWPRAVCLVALAAALAWAVTGGRALQLAGQSLPADLEGQDVELVGLVAGLPRQDGMGTSFEFEIESAVRGGRAQRVPPVVRLSWRTWGAGPMEGQGPAAAGVPQVRPGERWRLSARLHRPHGLSNPAGFDTELWLWERGLRATGHVRAGRGSGRAERLERTWAYPVQQARYAMRERLLAAVGQPRAGGVMVALLAGDQAAIAESDWTVFRVTGIAHLVSVSGLHVTMFAWLAMGLVRRLWRGLGRWRPALLWAVPTPVAAQVGGVALAAAYAAFSGWGVPSQRTVWMLVAVAALKLSGRHWPWPMVWLLALNAVLWIDPWALTQPGFWLSFVAVGVLFAQGPEATPPSDQARWKHALRDMLKTQAVVSVALTPLTLMLFGQFSLVGLLANLWAIPWVTLVVTPLTLLGALWSPLWWLGARAVEGLLWGLGGMATWPWAVIERPALPWGLAVLAVCGALLLVLRLPGLWRAWGVLLLWPALSYTPPRPLPGAFEVVAADIGQGTAVVVRTAQHTLLYDTGPPMGRLGDAAQRVLLPLLRENGDRLAGVVVSHGDADHAAGAGSVAAAFPRAQWWSSVDLPAVAAPLQRCVAGQRWVWDGVPFEVLHPSEADYASPASDNAMSCVLRVGEAPGPAVLLTGDISTAEETRLALAHPGLRANLLLVAHHGSKTSTAPVWLDTVQPAWAVVQAGHRNRYGHPHPVVLRRLDERNIPWVQSAHCGAAFWRSEQPGQLECHRDRVRRYWHDPDGESQADTVSMASMR